MRQRRDQGRGGRLAGSAGQRGGGDVDGVDPGVDGCHQGGQLAAGRVVGVQVDRQVKAFAQGRDELGRGGRSQHAGHVLDGQDVGAGGHNAVGEGQVVVQGVDGLGWIQEVSRVAQRHLGNGRSRGPDGLDGRLHLVHVVQGVKDAEDVNSAGRGFPHERIGDLLRVGRVAHRVAPAQEHLQADVRQCFAQLGQALPGILAQEPQGDVVGGTTPGLHREQLRGQHGHGRSGRKQVPGAHAGGQQGLVGVAERGVGDGDGGLGPQGCGKAFRAQFSQ